MPINTENNQDISLYSPYDVDMGNEDFNWIEFKTELDKSAKPIKDLVFNFETAVFLKNQIGLKFNLDNKQAIELARFVRDLLIAKVYLGNIVSEITRRLAVAPDLAKEISNRLISELFAPALEDIKKLHVEKFGSKQEPAPTAAPASKSDNASKPEGNINPNNVLDLRSQK